MAGADLRSRIGIVLQECGVDPYLTVAETLTMHAEFYEHPRSVEEVIGLVGLEGRSADRPSGCRPTAALAELTTWSLANGGELESLSVTQPSLEDVYLALTSDETR